MVSLVLYPYHGCLRNALIYAARVRSGLVAATRRENLRAAHRLGPGLTT
jgi:hypothetical protein